MFEVKGSAMKLAWWDTHWYSNSPGGSWGHRRIFSALDNAGIEIHRIGYPLRKDNNQERRYFDDLRSVIGENKERNFHNEIKEMLQDEGGGPDSLEIYLDELAKMTEYYDATWLSDTYDAILIFGQPIAFPFPKLVLVSMLARALQSNCPVIIYDNDLTATSLVRYVKRLYERYHDKPTFAGNIEDYVNIWAPHTKRISSRQKFLLWPYDKSLERDPSNSAENEFHLGYVGNGWAANGPNYPHAELFFNPMLAWCYNFGIWGKWDEEKRPKRLRLTYHDPVPVNQIHSIYAEKCRSSILMMHGNKSTPHLTPRNVEVIESGIPLFWDARIAKAKYSLLPSAPWLLSELSVNSGMELNVKIKKYDNLDQRNNIIERQRERIKMTRACTIEGWTDALEDIT